MHSASEGMRQPWQNALAMLYERIGADAVPIFLAQLNNSRYTSWVIASVWGMTASEVTGYRRCLCEDRKALRGSVSL
jgi:hypothetical protein